MKAPSGTRSHLTKSKMEREYSSVFELYGKEGLSNPEPPETNKRIQSSIGYHLRQRERDVTDYDWEQFITFARKHFAE